MITTSERKKIARIVISTDDESFIRKIESLISYTHKAKKPIRRNKGKVLTEFQNYLLRLACYY